MPMNPGVLPRHLLSAAGLSLLLCGQTLAQGLDASLLERATAEQAPLVRTLEKLVNIETGTGDAEGLGKVTTWLESELVQMGATVRREAAANGAVGDNLVAVFDGKGRKNIMLMAHIDTVHPRGTLEKAPFRIEGNLAYGPGIADAKGGVAVILHALRMLKQARFESFGKLTVLFDCDEEHGSRGARDLIRSLAKGQDYVLSFEPTSALKERLILGTSGGGQVIVQIRGKASHAGAAPEQGVNAIVEAADLILRTQGIVDTATGSKLNWTIIKGGGPASNVIPDQVTLTADWRYADPGLWQETRKRLEAAIARKRLPEARIETQFNLFMPAYNAGRRDRELVSKALAIYKEVGGTLEVAERSGGGTDASWASQDGTPVLESLGLPGLNYHSNQTEYVRIDAIPRRLYLVNRLVMDLALGK